MTHLVFLIKVHKEKQDRVLLAIVNTEQKGLEGHGFKTFKKQDFTGSR